MKTITKIIFLILILISANCFAYPHEPNGFRGVPWGASYEDVAKKFPNIVYDSFSSLNSPSIQVYNVTITNPYICGVPIDNPISMMFYKNQLYYVFLDLSGNNDFYTVMNRQRLLRQKLMESYGKETNYEFKKHSIDSGDMCYWWEGEKTIILYAAKFNYYVDGEKIPGSLSINLISTQINKSIPSNT